MSATLAANTAYIHWLRVDHNLAVNEQCLSEAERHQASRFRLPRDRLLYTAAHVFLRQILSRYTLLQPTEWQFERNAYGKPFIANPNYQWLQFNLTHTEGLIACALVREQAIGIDVEKLKPLEDLAALCGHAFHPLEANDILASGLAQVSLERFYRYWTLKEAYIKAKGIGLSLPLQKFAIQRSTLQRRWQVYDESGSIADQSWQLDARLLGTTHYLAYCIHSGCSANHCFKVVITPENSLSKVA